MKMGTKSILFGVHQFIIHPLFVFLAWWELYGFPWDPRLWIAFIVHDLGYWGKPEMDGEEGGKHVEWGARFMLFFVDWYIKPFDFKWHDFCLYHSRFYAKKDDKSFSRLCVADKFSIVLMPSWLYLPLARMTGEIEEYMELAKFRTAMGEPKYASMKVCIDDEERWFYDVKEYLRRWVKEHRNGGPDTWTPDLEKAKPRIARTETGVY
jgi:hypothetical protein